MGRRFASSLPIQYIGTEKGSTWMGFDAAGTLRTLFPEAQIYPKSRVFAACAYIHVGTYIYIYR